jgi:hypothetical protein
MAESRPGPLQRSSATPCALPCAFPPHSSGASSRGGQPLAVVGGGCAPIGRPCLQGCQSHALLHSLHSTPPSSMPAPPASPLPAPPCGGCSLAARGGARSDQTRLALMAGPYAHAAAHYSTRSIHPVPLPSSPSSLLLVCSSSRNAATRRTPSPPRPPPIHLAHSSAMSCAPVCAREQPS